MKSHVSLGSERILHIKYIDIKNKSNTYYFTQNLAFIVFFNSESVLSIFSIFCILVTCFVEDTYNILNRTNLRIHDQIISTQRDEILSL